jgi:hypothetical protein
LAITKFKNEFLEKSIMHIQPVSSTAVLPAFNNINSSHTHIEFPFNGFSILWKGDPAVKAYDKAYDVIKSGSLKREIYAELRTGEFKEILEIRRSIYSTAKRAYDAVSYVSGLFFGEKQLSQKRNSPPELFKIEDCRQEETVECFCYSYPVTFLESPTPVEFVLDVTAANNSGCLIPEGTKNRLSSTIISAIDLTGRTTLQKGNHSAGGFIIWIEDKSENKSEDRAFAFVVGPNLGQPFTLDKSYLDLFSKYFREGIVKNNFEIKRYRQINPFN